MPDILAEPVNLPCGAQLPNRIVKAAMTEGLADTCDQATAQHDTLYRRWSRGGAGLLVTGNVMVDRRFLERPGNVVVDERADRDRLRRWASAGTTHGNQLWMQISHPGRQCTRMSSREPICPSAVGLSMAGMFARPRAMSDAEIATAIDQYAYVATVARDSGFTGVQVHAAHGYLISQFLSPVTNLRGDDWGGRLENRARFLLAVVRAVRDAVGTRFPVGVKLNSADFQAGGFTLDDCLTVAGWLDGAGIDLLEISGGTYEKPAFLQHGPDDDTRRASTSRREAFFLEYAAAIRKVTSVPLMVTGGFRTSAAMRAAIDEDRIAAIGLARPMCVVPDLPRTLTLGDTVTAPSPETGLRLGSGVLGPRSGVRLLRSLNVQSEAAWFYRQILRLGDGLEPDLTLSAWQALTRHLRNEWRLSRARVTAS